MSWDDDEYACEFIKFDKRDQDQELLMGDPCFSEFLFIQWDTIRDEKNQWNKNRKRVNVQIIKRAINIKDSDTLIDNDLLVLDMGARLYNALRKLHINSPKTKYVKILKVDNPRNKFDIQYFCSEYKFQIQKKLK